MGYNENPMMLDKKYNVLNAGAKEAVDEAADVINKKKGIEKQGSPLTWIMQAAGAVAGGVGAALSGGDVKDVLTAAGTGALSPTSAVNTLSTGISDKANEGKVAEAEANAEANAQANATLEKNNSNVDLSSGGYGVTSGNSTSPPNSGQEVQGVDTSQSVFNSGVLDTELTGNTTGSTAVAKKLGEVKPYYENQKMSAAQYNKSVAMMTISGVSSLKKKGCYKPK